MTAAHRVHQRHEIHHVGAREQDEGGAPAHPRKGVRAEEAPILGGDRRNHEYEVAFGQDRLQRCRLDARLAQK